MLVIGPIVDKKSRIRLTSLTSKLMNRLTFLDILVLTENEETPIKQVGNGSITLKTFKTKNGFVKPGSRVQISQAAFVLSQLVAKS